jgi:hypothetical protein
MLQGFPQLFGENLKARKECHTSLRVARANLNRSDGWKFSVTPRSPLASSHPVSICSPSLESLSPSLPPSLPFSLPPPPRSPHSTYTHWHSTHNQEIINNINLICVPACALHKHHHKKSRQKEMIGGETSKYKCTTTFKSRSSALQMQSHCHV